MYSIIVPVYRVEKYLSQCIESILSQTYRDFELILVDDGSPDSCPAICDEYAKRDNRIKVIHKENSGSVSARNTGLRVAQGEYICFVDGDDFVLSDMLETYERELCNKKVDMICTGYSLYYGKHDIKTVLPHGKNGIYTKRQMNEELYTKMLSTTPFFSFYICPTVWSKCFRKSLVEKICVDIPDGISLGDDVGVTYPALLRANSISILNYTGYMYRQNLDSMTHTYDENLYKKIRTLIVYLKSIEKSMGWEAGNQINEYAVYLLILAKNNEFKYNKSDTYRIKKNNMRRYLSDPIFKEVLVHTSLSGVKNKFILSCFKKKFLIPIYLYESFIKTRD